MDSDDTFFSNNALESLYDVAITDLADVVWGRTVNWYCELGKSYYEINTLANPDKDIRRGTVAGFPVLSYNVTVWNKLLLRSFVLKYCLFFDEDLLKFEDNDFSCRICIHAKTISYIAINTYKYRQRIRGDRSKMYIKGVFTAFYIHLITNHRFLKPLASFHLALNLEYLLPILLNHLMAFDKLFVIQFL